jgi:hypothetical protein
MKLNTTILNKARGLSALSLVLACAIAAPASGASGRDTFGNTWRDSASGAVPEPNDFDGTFTDTLPADNGAPISVPLPFTDGFPFYGNVCRNIWISDNGWMSFSAAATSQPLPPTVIPSNTPPPPINNFIAPFWVDIRANVVINGDVVRYGNIAASNAFKIQVFGRDQVNNLPIWFQVILYEDGRFNFEYLSPDNVLSGVAIGIENPAGNDGIQIAAGGTVAPGVAMRQNYVIAFEPPLVLPAQCASFPNRGCTVFNGRLPGSLIGNVLNWGCGGIRSEAHEVVQSFTLAQASVVDITLTGGANLTAYLLDQCSERACIAGPSRNMRVPLGPGQYWIGVDAPLVPDEGPFTLTVNCAAIGAAATCGGGTSGTTVGGTTFWDTYACSGATPFTGAEEVFVVDVATATNLRAQVTSGSDLDVFILRADAGAITGADCVAHGDTTAVAWDAQPGQYLVVIDAAGGVADSFNLSLSCVIGMTCGAPAGVIDFTAVRQTVITGDTTGAPDVLDIYACDPAVVRDGPEDVWRLELPNAGIVTLRQVSGAPVDALITDYCNEGSCRGVKCGSLLTGGTHWLVVDRQAGVAGPYELEVAFDNIYNRWSECEMPVGTTLITDTSSSFWNLSDAGFCYTDPASINYPDGCIFAMYLTARCGSALHIPFFDTEGGHIRIFDIFRNEYVSLFARSPTWAMGPDTEIQWQDADCTSGSDPRWNEVVTDVYFDRPEGLCGIFRLEFINHSGNVWELYANCLGDRIPGFDIHDSLCTAMAEYDPLPNVNLLAANATYACPDITVTYTIRNDGCTSVQNFPVELVDDGTVVGVDLIPNLAAGQTTTRTFTVRFPATPTTYVTLNADFNGVITECIEVPGSACDPLSGTEYIELPGCLSVCQTIANAFANPAVTCSGTGVTIDASSSGASNCPGNLLEYQLRGPDGTITWQPLATFNNVGATQTGDFNVDVDVRCAGQTTCTDQIQVTVTVQREPTFGPASVTARDQSTCNRGVTVSWPAATFYGIGGTGAYNIYRASTDLNVDGSINCADAVAPGNLPLVTGITGLTYFDVATTPGTTYFYVVEAEDDTNPTTCSPQGPQNRGAVTRVDANGGTCVPITENEGNNAILLPRVDDRLRAGGTTPGFTPRYGEAFLELYWDTDRPLDVPGGEHFHLWRSSTPDRGFARLTTDAPFLQLPFYDEFDDIPNTGATAERGLWYYQVFTSDACDNQNTFFDCGGTDCASHP